MGRMSKGDQLAQVLGTLDEVNSWIGVCRATSPLTLSKILEREFRRIQNNLMLITTGLAGSKKRMKTGEVKHLEVLIDKLTAELPPLNRFIYPVGYLQLARAVCRRAERSIVELSINNAPSGPPLNLRGGWGSYVLRYLNRLSDALFTMGRWVNFKTGIAEEKWES